MRGSLVVVIALGALVAGCSPEPSRPPPPPSRVDAPLAPVKRSPLAARSTSSTPTASAKAEAPTLTASSASASSSAQPADRSAALDRARYPWLLDSSLKAPEAVEPLSSRFAPPPGFRRVAVAAGSFGEWLRGLPLAATGTAVVSYGGEVILPAGHANLAAVVAVDIGSADLQQCADSVIRMHAEWSWSSGARDMSYRAASGTPLPFAKWARGERPVATPNGKSITWEAKAKADPEGGSHASFRKYLDNVFMWANTVALSVQAKKISLTEARPGDFVIMPGNPGHAVLILDMAVSEKGERVALLGQGFMPAQSFQVLRPSPASAWFTLDPAAPGLTTPFWPTFPWDALRRLDG